MTPEKQALRILAWLWIRHGAVQSALLHRPGQVDGTYWKEKGYTTEPLCSHAAASSRIAELEARLEAAEADARSWRERGRGPMLHDPEFADRMQALEKALSNPEAARMFLVERGFLNADGTLPEKYGGRVEDAAGLAGLAEYDEVLAAIDSARSNTGGSAA